MCVGAKRDRNEADFAIRARRRSAERAEDRQATDRARAAFRSRHGRPATEAVQSPVAIGRYRRRTARIPRGHSLRSRSDRRERARSTRVPDPVKRGPRRPGRPCGSGKRREIHDRSRLCGRSHTRRVGLCIGADLSAGQGEGRRPSRSAARDRHRRR